MKQPDISLKKELSTVSYSSGPQPPGCGALPVRGLFGTGPQRKNKYVILFLLYWRSYSESCFIFKKRILF